MGRSFYYGTDAEFDVGTTAFAEKIVATPAAYRLVAAQATAYETLSKNFNFAYAAALDPKTRTRGLIAEKNATKAAVKKMAMQLAAIIDATPTVSDRQRIDLGLAVPGPRQRAKVPGELSLEVLAVVGNRVELVAHGVGNGPRRGKPKGVAGINLFSLIAEEPVLDISKWTYQGGFTRPRITAEFDAELPAGTRVFLTAFFYNDRQEAGVACNPVGVYLAGGAMSRPGGTEATAVA